MSNSAKTVTYQGREDGAESAGVTVQASGASRYFPLDTPVEDVPDSILKSIAGLKDTFKFDIKAASGGDA